MNEQENFDVKYMIKAKVLSSLLVKFSRPKCYD